MPAELNGPCAFCDAPAGQPCAFWCDTVEQDAEEDYSLRDHCGDE